MLITLAAAVSMRGPDGKCLGSQLCLDGSYLDPLDCTCPDAPVPSQTNSTTGSLCKQKKCWDDSKPNVYDCSCPKRPVKNVTDHYVDPPVPTEVPAPSEVPTEAPTPSEVPVRPPVIINTTTPIEVVWVTKA
jgi:hypothetical protein